MSTRTRRGRPCVAGDARTERIVFRVTPAERRAIHALARENQTTLGEWCRFGALQQQADGADPDEPPMVVVGGTIQAFSIIRRI
jgi:hypothetical protein